MTFSAFDTTLSGSLISVPIPVSGYRTFSIQADPANSGNIELKIAETSVAADETFKILAPGASFEYSVDILGNQRVFSGKQIKAIGTGRIVGFSD